MKNSETRLWTICENHPWLFMVAAMAAQTWFTLNNRALWYSDEVRYANAYQSMVQNNDWLVLTLNGVPYPDKPPVYFWFLRLLDVMTPADMPTVFFLGSALSGLLLLFATYALARTLDFGKTVSLAAILILLANFFLAALFHYYRMDLLFSAFIIAAHCCFFRAFAGQPQKQWGMAGFALAGIATLIKGPLGFILPVLTLLTWLIWRGGIKKIFSAAFFIGLGIMVAMILSWMLGVMQVEGPSYLLDTVIGMHVIKRATHTFHHQEAWHFYFIVLPLAWLPWTLLPITRAIRKKISLLPLRTIWVRRGTENQAASFLWCMFLGTFVLLSSLSGKVAIYILPVFSPLAILSARTLLEMDESRLKRFWTASGAFLCLLGIGIFIGGRFARLQAPVEGLGLGALILVGTGLLLVRQRFAAVRSNLMILALAVILWMYPFGLLTAPSLDASMSPISQALILKDYIDRGYAPLAYRTYSGVYTYYAGRNLFESNSREEIEQQLAKHSKAALVVQEKHWDSWKNRPEGLVQVDLQQSLGTIFP